MNDKKRLQFWIGNGLLGLSLVALVFMGNLWQYLGSSAMILWMIMAGAGMYLVTREDGSNMPD